MGAPPPGTTHTHTHTNATTALAAPSHQVASASVSPKKAATSNAAQAQAQAQARARAQAQTGTEAQQAAHPAPKHYTKPSNPIQNTQVPPAKAAPAATPTPHVAPSSSKAAPSANAQAVAHHAPTAVTPSPVAQGAAAGSVPGGFGRRPGNPNGYYCYPLPPRPKTKVMPTPPPRGHTGNWRPANLYENPTFHNVYEDIGPNGPQITAPHHQQQQHQDQHQPASQSLGFVCVCCTRCMA